MTDLLGELEARAPRRLLDELSTLSHALAKADRPRPEVELVLIGGQVIRGRLVAVGDDRSVPVAMIATGGQPRSPSVTFVRVDQIAAVGLTDAGLLVRALTSDAPIPSRLELARQVATRAEALTTRLGRPLAIAVADPHSDDDARRAIGLALPLVCDAITALAADAMGAAALAPITTLDLGAGSTPDVHRDGAKLVIQVSKLVTDAFTPASLRTAFERVL